MDFINCLIQTNNPENPQILKILIQTNNPENQITPHVHNKAFSPPLEQDHNPLDEKDDSVKSA
jgi:hypothetical protein